MKLITILICIFFINTLYGCPACNIHNYLRSSILSSGYIYKARVLKAKESNYAEVEILEIIKTKPFHNLNVSDIKVVHLYDAKDKTGNQYIFSNPTSHLPNYPVLDISFEDEVRFLSDTSGKISNINEAISLVEGISKYSVDLGLEYIQMNYDSAYKYLAQRIRDFRKFYKEKPNDLYVNYKIKNLTKAILLSDNEITRNFILNEIDTVISSATKNIKWDYIPFRGETLYGNYLRAMLEYSLNNKETNELIKSKLIRAINMNGYMNSVYCAYALAFSDYNSIKLQELSPDQKNCVALGFAYAASWNEYWFRTKNSETLVKLALKLSDNDTLTTCINNKFQKE